MVILGGILSFSQDPLAVCSDDQAGRQVLGGLLGRTDRAIQKLPVFENSQSAACLLPVGLSQVKHIEHSRLDERMVCERCVSFGSQ